MKHFLLSGLFLFTGLGAQAQTAQNALQFNGNDAHVAATNLSAGIANTTGFTMAGWIFPTNGATGFPNFDGAFGFRNESNLDFYVLQLSATNYEARFRNGNNQVFTINSPTVQLNAWQHVALVYTGTALQFYHNGNLANTMSANGSVTNPNVPFFMGKLPFQSFNFEFNGRIDDVALWNRALTAAEVLCLYNQALDTSMAGLVAYFPMNQGIAGGNNTSITSLLNAKGGPNGSFYNMARNGTTNNFLAGINKTTQFIDTICNGQQYAFGGQVFTQPGTYSFFAAGAEGCDSLVELTLVADSVDVGIFQNGLMLTAALAGASYMWIDCTTKLPVPNQVGQSFVVSENGSYAVVVNDGNCVDTSACITYSTIGMQEMERDYSIRTFPNPATNQLHVSGPISLNAVPMEIYSAVGQRVTTMVYDSINGLDISNLASGIYILTVSIPNQQPIQVRFQKL